MAEEKTESAAPAEVRLTLEDAKEAARRLTGQSPHVVAGALAGDTRSTWTEAQLKKRVTDFVDREAS